MSTRKRFNSFLKESTFNPQKTYLGGPKGYEDKFGYYEKEYETKYDAKGKAIGRQLKNLKVATGSSFYTEKELVAKALKEAYEKDMSIAPCRRIDPATVDASKYQLKGKDLENFKFFAHLKKYKNYNSFIRNLYYQGLKFGRNYTFTETQVRKAYEVIKGIQAIENCPETPAPLPVKDDKK